MNNILSSYPFKNFQKNEKKILKIVNKVFKSGKYILGEQVDYFQKEFAKYVGTKFAVGVGNGTDALYLALKSLDIKKNDEVITVSHTNVATVMSIIMTGAKPVLVDIEEDYFTIDANKIEKKINSKTKALLIVHLYGQPALMNKINKIAKNYGLFVVEDCAQSHGSLFNRKMTGSIGDIGCFSFYPTKNLGAYGDGGMVVTNNKKIKEKILLMREYGWKTRFNSVSYGINSRLDEIQAAILRQKLKFLDSDNKKRQVIAKHYFNELKHTSLLLPKIRENSSHVFHLYVVRSNKRKKIMDKLKQKKISTAIQYPIPIHKQKYFKNLNNKNLKVTEKICREIFSLPMYPELSNKNLFYITENLKNILR